MGAMKVLRNGRWVDLKQDNARLAAKQQAAAEQRARDEAAIRGVIDDALAAGDIRFAQINRSIAREAGIEIV